MITTTIERIQEEYAKCVKSFAKELKDVEADGIPAPHIPIAGENYDSCAYKMAFVGMETYGWGNIRDFLEEAEKNPKSAVIKYEGWFHSAGMLKHDSGTTFWGFIITFLAKFYHIDRKILKTPNSDGTYNNILSSFLWGNSNAIERYEVTAKGKGVSKDVWKKVKECSAKLDSINHIINAASPKIIFLLYKNVNANYILQDTNVSEEIPEIKYAYRSILDTDLGYTYYYLREQDTHVFVLPHPTWMGLYSPAKQSGFADSLINSINQLKIWPSLPTCADDWCKFETTKSNSSYKYKFIADLAEFLVTRSLIMTGEELQMIFNKNQIKTSYGTKYTEEGGRGIYRVIKCAWKYYYNRKQWQDAFNISRAFVGKNLKFTY